jgi:hypothetical protein
LFGLLSVEIAKMDAKIGQNDLEISLKGEDIADKFLFWSIPGNYDIYAEITVTYTPLGSITPLSITRTTPILTSKMLRENTFSLDDAHLCLVYFSNISLKDNSKNFNLGSCQG